MNAEYLNMTTTHLPTQTADTNVTVAPELRKGTIIAAIGDNLAIPIVGKEATPPCY